MYIYIYTYMCMYIYCSLRQCWDMASRCLCVALNRRVLTPFLFATQGTPLGSAGMCFSMPVCGSKRRVLTSFLSFAQHRLLRDAVPGCGFCSLVCGSKRRVLTGFLSATQVTP